MSFSFNCVIIFIGSRPLYFWPQNLPIFQPNRSNFNFGIFNLKTFFRQIFQTSSYSFFLVPEINFLKFLMGRGKITLLLSAHFPCLFIAIKRKRHSLHYTFNGNFIKITYNSTFWNATPMETTALTYNVRGEPK